MFLDVRLPGIDGLETLKIIKQIDKDIPVVMVTVVDTIKTAVKAMQLGACDYITKPFNINFFKNFVDEVLNKNFVQKSQSDINLLIDDTKKDMLAKGADLNTATEAFESKLKELVV